MQSLAEFVASVNGQFIADGDPYGAQCVVPVERWLANLGLPPLPGNAIDFWADFHPAAPPQANTPTAVPAPGDVMVWGQEVGPYGHTGICVSATIESFTSLDQNWPLNSPCHLQPHSYAGVIGWRHPLVLDQTRVQTGGSAMPQTPFYITVKAGAHWRGIPDGQDMGPVNINPDTVLKVVEVANDGVSDWYRSDLGSWWLVNTDTNPAPAPAQAQPATPAASPASADIESRMAALEAWARTLNYRG